MKRPTVRKILIPTIALFVILILACCLVACREKGDDELPSVPSGNDMTEEGAEDAEIIDIELLSDDNGYVIEAGETLKFAFVAEYRGNYIFGMDSSVNLELRSDDTPVETVGGAFSRELSSGAKFEFEARNAGSETVTGNISVDVAGVSDDRITVEAAANESFIMKFSPAGSAMYDINGSAGVKILDVLYAEASGELVRIDMYGETEYAPANVAQFFLSGDGNYYVVAQNARNSAGECEVSFALTEAELRNGNGIELVSNGNYKFYKYFYDGIAGYNVKITFDNIEDEKDVLQSVVFDASGKRLPAASFSYGEIRLNNVNKGAYYVGVRLISDEAFTLDTAPQIVAEEALYEWKITKDGKEIAVGFGNVAELKRNATYKFELLYRVDGETEKIFPIDIVAGDAAGLVIDGASGHVTVTAARDAGDSFTLGGIAGDGTVYSYTLTVIPI